MSTEAVLLGFSTELEKIIDKRLDSGICYYWYGVYDAGLQLFLLLSLSEEDERYKKRYHVQLK
jgi:hypothetical protein